MLTSKQIRLILDRDKHGPGYSDDVEIGRLQATLSIMLEVAVRSGR